MAKEIERKYLVEIGAAFRPQKTSIIESAYLSVVPEVRIARYRGAPGSYELTVKGEGGIEREEIIIGQVDDVQGNAIWEMTDPQTRLQKIRDVLGGWEVDTYLGRHAPLVVAECELSYSAQRLPEVPAGLKLLVEVTEDTRFKNKNLVRLDREEIERAVAEVMATVTGGF